LEYYRQSSEDAKAGAFGYAELFTLLHQYDSAKYYYSLVDTASPRIRRSYLTSIGEYYFEQKLYDKALPNFTRSLDYHKQLNDRNPVMQTLVDIAKTYLALGKDDSAFAYGNESFIMAKQTGARQVKKAACEILSAVYDHRHRGDSAYLYYKQYTSIKDSVLNDQVKGKLAAYTFEQKMELLNNEKQIQQVQLQKERLLKNILIGGVIVLFLLGIIIFRNIILKRKNEKLNLENKLKEQQFASEHAKAEFQLQATGLEMQALRALLNERLRISRELHDDIGSTLGSISIYSEVAKKRTEKNENTNEVLSKIGIASRELIDKMSDIVWSLNPNNESFEQLQNRMMTFAAMILSPRNIQYDFIADEELKKMQFTGEQRKNIFLIFKEALHNVVKYADCNKVSITLFAKTNSLVMTIKDNGKGFNTSTIRMNETFQAEHESLGGNGIKNMHARADDMDAKLCISSGINEGTTVQLILHL